jgi:hypothetical protein
MPESSNPEQSIRSSFMGWSPREHLYSWQGIYEHWMYQQRSNEMAIPLIQFTIWQIRWGSEVSLVATVALVRLPGWELSAGLHIGQPSDPAAHQRSGASLGMLMYARYLPTTSSPAHSNKKGTS